MSLIPSFLSVSPSLSLIFFSYFLLQIAGTLPFQKTTDGTGHTHVTHQQAKSHVKAHETGVRHMCNGGKGLLLTASFDFEVCVCCCCCNCFFSVSFSSVSSCVSPPLLRPPDNLLFSFLVSPVMVGTRQV